jgi:hypothetical protein
VEYWPGMLWNAGPTSRGILARHAVESAGVGDVIVKLEIGNGGARS